MPHPESEHGLRARLACSLKETEDVNALRLKQDAELVALRAEVRAWKDGVCQDCAEKDQALAAASARADAATIAWAQHADSETTRLVSHNAELTNALAAARRDCEALGAAFMGLRETYGFVLAFAREVLGVLERGEQNRMLRVPDRTIKLLRCKDPIPTTDDVLAEARALVGPAAAAGCPTCGCTATKDPGVPCSDSWHDLRAEMGS